MPSVMNQLYSRRGNPADIGSEAANPWANYQAPAQTRLSDTRAPGLGSFFLRRVAPIWGAAAGGAALSALYSGAGAAGSAAGAGSAVPAVPAAGAATGAAGGAAATAAPVAGGFMSTPAANLGVNAGLTVAGMVQGNRAAGQARRDQLEQYRQGLALQRQQLETEARNADLDREDARALNAAVNDLRRRELEAAEEQRAFDRGLLEQRETRLAPYRRASEQALARLSAMWGN